MPDPKLIIRRRSDRGRSPLPVLARLSIVLLTMTSLLLVGAGVAVARLYLEVTQIVPAVQDIEAFFDAAEAGQFEPIEVVDRDGERLFYLSNPRAERAEPVGLSAEASIQVPNHLVSAVIAAQDPSFWDNPGYVPGRAAGALAGDLIQRGERPRQHTITEQLVAATLLPLEPYADYSFRRDFRLLLLAERLTQRYEKRQILAWYLNSAHFGARAYGIDAAALVYFGKHADGLTLAESALLAGLPDSEVEHPATEAELRSARNAVLRAMAEQGLITARQSRAARAEPVGVRLDSARLFRDRILGPLTQEKLVENLGASSLSRGGLTVQLTVDDELQAQARCVLATQLRRLQGGNPSATAAAPGGEPCVAAGMLPPLRPGDAGVDHRVGSGAAVVISPAEGEVRALAVNPGDAGPELVFEPTSTGEALYPFVYLTAFSRGFAPGSMVLDLSQEAGLTDEELADYQGPVQMRTALVGRLEAAGRRTLELAGQQNVLRTLGPLGLTGPEGRRPTAEEIVEGEVPVSLVTLTQAYGVVANGGQRTGVTGDAGQLEPLILRRVVDRFGRMVFEASPRSQSILGEGLAYLLVDVLSDEAARWPVYGQPNVFEIGRPAGTVPARAPDGSGAWTVGFTPNLAVGVWLGNSDGSPTNGLQAENGPGSVWHALSRHATRNEPAQAWTQPQSVSTVEVCVPSGLLPGQHCPVVADEVFLQGTEPTATDNLYQPFRVNRETGRLATLATPLSLVEERVYMVPPPEAAAWAEAAGVERPPSEYDPLPEGESGGADVRIDAPEPFEVVSGGFAVRGDAHPDGFSYYRLQFGQGLNPSRWIQVGEDRSQRVWGGVLGTWETAGLSGLYTLQLVVVDEDDGLLTASVPVTIDGQAPAVEVLLPLSDEMLSAEGSDTFVAEVRAQDDVGVARVEFYLDGLQLASVTSAPYFVELPLPDPGAHTFQAVAVDRSGRRGESRVIEFEVVP